MIIKKCACGREFSEVPPNAKVWPNFGGLLADCECKSTLFSPCDHLEIDEDHNNCMVCGKDLTMERMSSLIDQAVDELNDA